MSQKQTKTAINPTREQDYPEWYQQVIKAADLAENSPVRGCMVIKPWGYGIWENIQRQLDQRFKDTGHENAYFPLFVPLSYLEKEAAHVDGFAKECAVVTHHRLEDDGEGGLKPAGKLDEPLIVRPTSEAIIGEVYSKWVQSYRDLPILINQWANVVRWEMRTRLFIRTSEFLWQEGHTVHANEEEARAETEKMLDVYAEFAENVLAMPVIRGEKTPDERFPGAVSTYCIEAFMQDRKGLQAGTSHYLGQNFSKAQDIKFSDKDGEVKFAHTTSWGVSTRLVGGLIMTHSDDDGLVLPPRVAPKHVVILPIFRGDDDKAEVMAYCESLEKDLRNKQFHDRRIEVSIDTRDMRGGEKTWQHIKKGVPIRLEVGPRDMQNDSVFMGRRDLGAKEKKSMPRVEFLSEVVGILDDMQDGMLNRAREHLASITKDIDTFDDFKDFFTPKNKNKPEIHGGVASCYWSDDPKVLEMLKPLKVTARCIPLEQNHAEGRCIFTGKATKVKVLFAKAY
jgi:prolyl-tRNA synthetase